ncbi:MAG: ankyrin repeat domain-containing protein [Methylophilaceae bacterium]
MGENITALEQESANGLNINACFVICEYIEEPPIILVLDQNKTNALNWLLTKKVNLNLKDNPAIVMAAARCSAETIQLLLKHGAKINAKDNVGKTAMGAALYSNRVDLIPILIAHGYNILADGTSLRQAVSHRQYKAIQLFLASGINVNFHVKDMVYPYNTSPVGVAAQNNDIELVKLLVKHGADVTIKNSYGERPYNYAVEHNNSEMMQFIQSLEPEQWHNDEQKVTALKAYKLPPELISLLRSNDRTFKIEDPESGIKFITFNSLLNAKEVTWQKHQFLDLLSEVDNYGNGGGVLVWYPKKKCLASADYEHGEFKVLGSWKDFIANPSACIHQIFS